MRTSKTSGVLHTEYVLNGTQILAEYIEDFRYIIYMYDAEGSPIGMMYREYDYAEGEFDVFWYEKNLQGDVIAVYNSEGTVHLRYKYDAWGNVTTTYHNNATYTGAQYNPFTYRGYYRDSETGFYYLNSRYYDPVIARFINVDDIGVLLATPNGFTDKNIYAYCDNNPITRADDGGEFWHIIVGAVVGGVVGGGAKLFTNWISGEDDIWNGVLTASFTGAASGALAATGAGLAIQAAGGAVISMTGNAVQQNIDIAQGKKEAFVVSEMLIEGAKGAISSLIGGQNHDSKHLMNLGKQTIKRTKNAFKHNGFGSGVNTMIKSFAYYGKSTKSYYKHFFKKDVPLDFFLSSISNLIN